MTVYSTFCSLGRISSIGDHVRPPRPSSPQTTGTPRINNSKPVKWSNDWFHLSALVRWTFTLTPDLPYSCSSPTIILSVRTPDGTCRSSFRPAAVICSRFMRQKVLILLKRKLFEVDPPVGFNEGKERISLSSRFPYRLKFGWIHNHWQ